MDGQTHAICLTHQGSTALLSMNRPNVLNAHDWGLVNELHSALDELESLPGIEAVVISGEGRAFSTGIDLTALAMGELSIEWFRRFDEALRRIELLPLLTVARMHGYSLGGGLMIGLACDLRISCDECRFGFPAVSEALVPGMGTYRLPRFIGLGHAKRLVLTGDLIDARTALAMGLVDWVVPAERLRNATEDIIERTTRNSSHARSLARELVISAFEVDFDHAMERYLDRQQQCLESEAHKRAMQGYLEKRVMRQR
ncbi:enoyl-CoA hydratase/isomerase family protein [Rhizobium laguerreae]|uniref:enoyl-CoA hydratase/isomerase family protein n=1 Tax=Rhizobium laguerreae TaxID=1076926 RepID=UPI001C91C68E|nr:enoyl-CoA hydratase/isomerase family protein [Rhizobium laguerreae]MBY3203458.1 enoyl-CoA hydratase/isomerase family protein [Rhizobium laguerreae]